MITAALLAAVVGAVEAAPGVVIAVADVREVQVVQLSKAKWALAKS